MKYTNKKLYKFIRNKTQAPSQNGGLDKQAPAQHSQAPAQHSLSKFFMRQPWTIFAIQLRPMPRKVNVRHRIEKTDESDPDLWSTQRQDPDLFWDQ